MVGTVLVTSRAAVTKPLMRTNLRKERFASFLQVEATVHHSREDMAAGAEQSWSREGAMDERWYSVLSLLLVQSKS